MESSAAALLMVAGVFLVRFQLTDEAQALNPPYPNGTIIDMPKEIYDGLPPPFPVESFDSECESHWRQAPGSQVFMKWLVKILYDPFQYQGSNADEKPPHNLGSGMAITTRHVLTAWSPYVINIRALEEAQHLSVVNFVMQYSKAKPEPGEFGKFPWAANNRGLVKSKGCILGTHAVLEWKKISNNRIYSNFSRPFKDYTNNFLILILKSALSVLDWTLWQRAPIDYSTNDDAAFTPLRWFQSDNRVRCHIPKWNTSYHKDHRLGFARIIQEGFSYKAWRYEGKCTQLLCESYCDKYKVVGSLFPNDHIHIGNDRQRCIIDCSRRDPLSPLEREEASKGNIPQETALAREFFMKLLCIKRQRERQQGVKEMFSYNYDPHNTDRKFLIEGLSRKKDSENCYELHGQTDKKTEISVLYGAPLVCNGEAVAMVVKCFPDALVVAPILLVRQMLLRLNPNVEFFKEFRGSEMLGRLKKVSLGNSKLNAKGD